MARCSTRRMIGPVIVVDNADRRAMEVAEKSRTHGIIEMSEAILNPPETGGIMAAPKAGMRKPRRNVGTVARKATTRTSAGRNKLTQTKVDRAEETQEGVKQHNTLRAPNEPELDGALPS